MEVVGEDDKGNWVPYTPPRLRSSAQMLEQVALKLSEEGGTFSLTHDPSKKPADGPWMAGMEWGREAPDSPMAGAAAYGLGESAGQAMDTMLDDAGVER